MNHSKEPLDNLRQKDILNKEIKNDFYKSKYEKERNDSLSNKDPLDGLKEKLNHLL